MDTDNNMTHNWHQIDHRHGHEARELLIDIWDLIKSWRSRRRERANEIRERKRAERQRALHYKPKMSEREFYDQEYLNEK